MTPEQQNNIKTQDNEQNTTSRPSSPSDQTPVAASKTDGQTATKRPRRKRLDLPFDNRKQDAGTWAFDHRIGLMVTLIAYLVLMIVFVSSKIVIGRRAQSETMYIDLQSLAELQKEKERLEEEIRRKQQERDPIDWRSIRNQTSNENALNEQLKDDRGTNAAAINEAAREAQERMRRNREAYEQGLAEQEAIRNQNQGSKGDSERQDSKKKGRVTVSFSFTDPVRTSRYLHIPAYLCEGGGDVVVQAKINRQGKVTSAHVVSGGDACMREAALNATRMSKFNTDPKAPAQQSGTITYIFIPQ